MKTYACILFNNCSIWQISLLQKFLKDKEWDLVTFSIDGLPVVTDGGLTIQVDRSLLNADPKKFDLILLPGGIVTPFLAENQHLQTFLKNSNGLIAASCASAVLVASSGLINGNFTCMPHIQEYYSSYFKNGNFLNTDLCVNDRIITSKGFAHYELTIEVLHKLGITNGDPRIPKLVLKLSRNAASESVSL